MLTSLRALLLCSIIALIGSGCQTKSNSANMVSDTQAADIQVGGLYVTKDSANIYSVSKVLVLDNQNGIVHLRVYRDTFSLKPKNLNSDSLHIMVGHFPLAKEGFLADKPELIKTEPVREDELEGYKMYLDAMKSQ